MKEAVRVLSIQLLVSSHTPEPFENAMPATAQSPHQYAKDKQSTCLGMFFKIPLF